MTNQEILDRLDALAYHQDDQELNETLKLVALLRSRIIQPETQHVSFTINGSPEIIAAALAEVIAANSRPENLKDWRDRLDRAS